MANRETKLNIVVDAQNRTQGTFNALKSNLDEIRQRHDGLIAAMRGVGTAGAIAFGGLAFLTKGIVEAGASIEQTQIAFETMLGSADLARQTLMELSQFAATTPFELPQLEETSKRLLAYGFAAADLLPTLEMLGNISAGVGMDKLPQLTLAFGQVRAATKLTGMELRQFSEAGVPLLQALVDQFNRNGGAMRTVEGNAEKVGAKMESLNHTLDKQNNRLREMQKNGNTTSAAYKNLRLDIARTKEQLAELPSLTSDYSEQVQVTAADVLEMVSAGEITFAQVQEALTALTTEGGRFNDLMLKQSQSLAGQWSNFKDQISLTARAIGEQLLPYLKPVMDHLIALAGSVRTFATEHPKLTAAILVGALAFTGLLAVLLPIAIALPGIILMFTGLGIAFAAVTAVSAPMLLAIGAVIAILGVLVANGYTTKEAWQSVWLGIKLITADAANAVIGTVEAMINFVIDGVNKAIKAINKVISATNAVPGIGKLLPKISEIDRLSLDRFDTDLIASKDLAGRSNPLPLPSAGNVIQMVGNTFLSESVAEQIGNMIIGQLKRSSQL